MNRFRQLPLLTPNQCDIRERLNCCEKYAQCPSKHCHIDSSKASNGTLLDVMDWIDEAASDTDRVERGEIQDLTEIAREMIIKAVSALGIGLSIEWPPEK